MMDELDRYQEELERRQEAIASTAAVCSAPLADMTEELYPVTIIGCIRCVDGWYQAGYDGKTKTIKPLERI